MVTSYSRLDPAIRHDISIESSGSGSTAVVKRQNHRIRSRLCPDSESHNMHVGHMLSVKERPVKSDSKGIALDGAAGQDGTCPTEQHSCEPADDK